MDTMLMKKTNVTFSSGLPPCPKRPPHHDKDQAARLSVSKVVPSPSIPFVSDQASDSFEFWPKPFSFPDQEGHGPGGADEANLGPVGTIAAPDHSNYIYNYENATHSRSNSSETVDDFKEPDQNSVDAGDGRSWKSQSPSEIDIQFELARRLHPDMDPRKLRRIVTNRISAQRSRLRRIKYVTELEYRKMSLHAKISQLSFEIASESNKKEELLTEKTSLKQKMSFLVDDGLLKNVEKKLLTKEVDRLIQVLLRQKQEQEVDVPDLNFQFTIPLSTGQNGEQTSGGDANMLEQESELQSWVGSENNNCASEQYDELQQMAMFWSDPTRNYCGVGTGGDGTGSASLSQKYNGVDDVMVKCETTKDLLSIN